MIYTDITNLVRIRYQSLWNNAKSVERTGAFLVPLVGSEGYILYRYYHGYKWYILEIRLKNNFNILSHIPVDPENTKQLVDFKGFQAKVNSYHQE